LLCEIRDLRAELEKLKRQWAEDDRDITELEDENNQLRAELAAEREKVSALEIKVNNQQDWLVEWRKCEEALKAERKKREEAEADVYKLGQENIELEADLSATKKKCDEYREMANKVQIGGESFQLQFLAEEEDKCRGLEIQVEVLRESLDSILLEIQAPDKTSGIDEYKQVIKFVAEIAQEALTNPPDRTATIRKVLEAAEEQARLGAETHCDNHSVYFAACADTNKAVRERRHA
jgi:chromosome segregation ATPase